jgi:outer membrane protein TolC
MQCGAGPDGPPADVRDAPDAPCGSDVRRAAMTARRRAATAHAVLLALAVGAAGAAGAQAAPRALTLADALRLAAERQPRLAGARALRASADARATAVRALLRPQVGVSAALTGTTAPSRVGRGTGGSGGAGGDSTGGGGTPAGGAGGGVQTGFRSNFSTGLTVDQAVFRPRLVAEAAAARAEARAAGADAEQIALDVAFQVVDAYFAQLRAEQLARVQEEQLREFERSARDLAVREQAGSGRRVDALRAEAQRALAVVAVREARAVAAQAAAALVATVGVRDSAFAIDTALAAPGPAPRSLDSLLATAERESPILRAATAVVEQRRAFVRAARADLLPSLGLQLGAGYQQSDLNPRAGFTTLGLSLGWPAFTSGANQALVRAAEAETRLAESEAQVERNELRRRVAAALARWREAERRSGEAGAGVRAAREALRIVRGAYAEGAVLLVEVFQAQGDVLRAETGRVQALVDARVAAAELALALGRVPSA